MQTLLHLPASLPEVNIIKSNRDHHNTKALITIINAKFISNHGLVPNAQTDPYTIVDEMITIPLLHERNYRRWDYDCRYFFDLVISSSYKHFSSPEEYHEFYFEASADFIDASWQYSHQLLQHQVVCHSPLESRCKTGLDGDIIQSLEKGNIGEAMKCLGKYAYPHVCEEFFTWKTNQMIANWDQSISLRSSSPAAEKNYDTTSSSSAEQLRVYQEQKQLILNRLRNDRCPICFCSQSHTKVITQCQHNFCKECLDQWFTQYHSCPLCKEMYVNYIIIRKGELARPTKAQVIQQLLENNLGQSFVLFFTNEFDVLSDLHGTNIEYKLCKSAHTNSIGKYIKELREGKIQLLCINKTSCTGLNLGFVDQIIEYEPQSKYHELHTRGCLMRLDRAKNIVVNTLHL